MVDASPFRILLAVFALSPGLSVAAQEGTDKGKTVQGYLLVTGDPKILAKREMPYGATRADYNKAFPNDHFRIVPWGEDRLLVIDLATGPLGKLRCEGLLVRAFLDRRSPDGTLDVARLSPEEIQAAQSALGGSWMSVPGKPRGVPAYLSIDEWIRIDLTFGGKTKSVRLPSNMDRRRTTMDVAARRYNHQRPFANVPEESFRRDETTLRFFGPALRVATEGTLLYAKTLESLQKEIDKGNRGVATDLLRSLGRTVPDDADRILNVSEMPDALRARLNGLLESSWKNYGFASRQEAMAFLSNGDGYRAWTELGAVQFLDPGNPSQHRPPVFGSGTITTVPGYYP